MNINNFVKILNEKNIVGLLNLALLLTNEKREFDSSSSTLAYDLRDKIKRIGNLRGLEIVFDNNKLSFVIENIKCEIKSYNHRKKAMNRNDQVVPKQCFLFTDNNKDLIDTCSCVSIGHITNANRKKFFDVFIEYRAQNGEMYLVDLLTANIDGNISTEDNEYIPTFFNPKKQAKELLENE